MSPDQVTPRYKPSSSRLSLSEGLPWWMVAMRRCWYNRFHPRVLQARLRPFAHLEARNKVSLIRASTRLP